MKNTKFERVIFIIVSILFFIYSFTLIYPYVWLLINTFKNNGEYLDNSFGFPTVWRFSNYIKAFEQLKVTGSNTTLIGMFLNSVLLSTLGSLFGIILSSLAAYVVAKYQFRGRKLIYTVAIFSMIIPIVGSLPAQYKLVSSLGFKNNLFGIALLYAAPFGFNFIMLYGAFKSVSWDYAEAAMIDGCSKFRIFTRIMLPMVSPVIKAIFIIQFIGIWNDYMTPLLYLKKTPTLSYGLYAFEQNMIYRGANYPIYFAAVIMSLIPILILFIVFQKTLLENTTAGGLKG